MAGILQKGFRKLGHDSTVVSSEHEAVNAIMTEEFLAIVFDVTMSEMDGRHVAGVVDDFCRETGISKPPFVLMTQAGTGEGLSGPPVDRVVEKPIDFNDLLAVIRNVAQ